MVKYEKIFTVTLEKTERHASGISNEGIYSSEKICSTSLIFNTAYRLLIPAEAKQN